MPSQHPKQHPPEIAEFGPASASASAGTSRDSSPEPTGPTAPPGVTEADYARLTAAEVLFKGGHWTATSGRLKRHMRAIGQVEGELFDLAGECAGPDGPGPRPGHGHGSEDPEGEAEGEGEIPMPPCARADRVIAQARTVLHTLDLEWGLRTVPGLDTAVAAYNGIRVRAADELDALVAPCRGTDRLENTNTNAKAKRNANGKMKASGSKNGNRSEDEPEDAIARLDAAWSDFQALCAALVGWWARWAAEYRAGAVRVQDEYAKWYKVPAGDGVSLWRT